MPNPDVPLLSEEAIKRVVKSVLWTEKQLQNRGLPQTKPPRQMPPFGIVRGLALDDVTGTTGTFMIESVKALGQSSPTPNDPLMVGNPHHMIYQQGQTVYAIYHYQVAGPAGTSGDDYINSAYWEAMPLENGDIVYAQVNKPGGVTPETGTFAFDNAIPIVGNGLQGMASLVYDEFNNPVYSGTGFVYHGSGVGGEGVAVNRNNRSFNDNQAVIFFRLKTTGIWIPEDTGTGVGSVVVQFRLYDDKSYSDLAVLAKPVDDAGVIIDGADPFYVIDWEHQYWGLAAYTDGDSEAEEHPGYYGHALFSTLDWNDTEVPGYTIISMEGPAQFGLVDLKEAVGETNPDEAKANWVGSSDFHGRPLSGRRPRFEDTSINGNFTVFDDLGIAANGLEDSRWIVKWEENGEYYILWRALDQTESDYGLVISTIPAGSVTGGGSNTVTLGSQSDAVVRLKRSGNSFSPVTVGGGTSQVLLTGLWGAKTDLRASSGQPIFVKGQVVGTGFIVDPWDLRMLPGFLNNVPQLPGFNSGDDAELKDIHDWLEIVIGHILGEDQALQHRAGVKPRWESTGTDCPGTGT